MKKPGIYADIDIDAYHADDGISSSGISLILDCPKRYWWEYIAVREKEKKGRAFDLGSALHTSVLEPKEFNSRFYLLRDSFDMRTKAGKEAFAKIEEETQGLTIIKGADCEILLGMDMAVSNHPIWEKIKIESGNVEHSVYWDAGIYSTRLRARPDFYNDSIIIDLKTTDSIASFSKSVYNYGYHRQAAMQIDGLEACDGNKRHFAFFVVEKKAPYLTACFTLDEQAIEQGRAEYLEAAATYSECLRFNSWPGYDEKFQLLKLPKWAVKREEEEII